VSYNPEQQAILDQLNGPAPAVDHDRLRDDLYEWRRHNDPATNPNSLYRSDPRRYARDEAAQLAVFAKAGVNPTAQPPAPQQTFTVPDKLPEGLQGMVDTEIARLNANPTAAVMEANDLRRAIGEPAYNDLVASARRYKPNLSDAEKCSRTLLKLYAGQAAFAAKHGRR
jgi:hypothetical protein